MFRLITSDTKLQISDNTYVDYSLSEYRNEFIEKNNEIDLGSALFLNHIFVLAIKPHEFDWEFDVYYSMRQSVISLYDMIESVNERLGNSHKIKQIVIEKQHVDLKDDEFETLIELFEIVFSDIDFTIHVKEK